VKPFLRILGIAVVLAAAFALGFVLWGERFEALFGHDACVEWFSRIRPVAWLAGIGLLVADLVLPVPATGVMAALGAVYGGVTGAAVATVGSTLAALVGYGLARLAGDRGARLLAGRGELERFRALFDRWGGAAIVVSRWLPILPEVTSVLAGLAGMRFGGFLVAVLLGTVPASLVFASIGAASAARPGWGVLVAVAVPLLLWPVFLCVVRRTRR